MSEIWLIADLHLSHEKMVTGWNNDGQGPRSSFAATIEEHDEKIIERINSVVMKRDKFYLLGDIALSKAGLDKVARINGHKRLVLGNHDQDSVARYASHFEKLCGAKVLGEGFVLTHIPIHPACLNRRSMQVNIHGHMHDQHIAWPKKTERYLIGDEDPLIEWKVEPDPRYVGVSCEQVGYTPINFETIRERVKDLIA